MTRVYIAADVADAQIVRGLLADAGIRSVIMGETLGMASGDLPPTTTKPEVWVAQADFTVARQLVEANEARTHVNACPRCGADVRGCADPDCPKCGAALRPAGPAWQCPTCGERIDGQFTACWRCAADVELPQT